MVIFLASLSMLFAAGIVGYLVIRFRADSWPPPGAPALPPTLWLSTAFALLVSIAVQLALRSIRAGRQRALIGWLSTALALAAGFLAVQSLSWARILGEASFGASLYGFSFIMLTGLHGAHALGGIAALVTVLILALRGSYSWAHFPGVRNCALYWHYLSVVWLILFGLFLTTF
jgi:heme/copper-type cytochrome/quinol oxidase subunit 3